MTHLSFQFSILVFSDLFATLLDNTTHSIGPPRKCLTISTNLDDLLSTGILKNRGKGQKDGKKGARDISLHNIHYQTYFQSEPSLLLLLALDL